MLHRFLGNISTVVGLVLIIGTIYLQLSPQTAEHLHKIQSIPGKPISLGSAINMLLFILGIISFITGIKILKGSRSKLIKSLSTFSLLVISIVVAFITFLFIMFRIVYIELIYITEGPKITKSENTWHIYSNPYYKYSVEFPSNMKVHEYFDKKTSEFKYIFDNQVVNKPVPENGYLVLERRILISSSEYKNLPEDLPIYAGYGTYNGRITYKPIKIGGREVYQFENMDPETELKFVTTFIKVGENTFTVDLQEPFIDQELREVYNKMILSLKEIKN